MAKVIAVFEIVRPDEVIAPGKAFTSTGEELDYLTKVGAVRKPTKEDGDTGTDVENDDSGKEAGKATPEPKPAATAKATGSAKGKATTKIDDGGI